MSAGRDPHDGGNAGQPPATPPIFRPPPPPLRRATPAPDAHPAGGSADAGASESPPARRDSYETLPGLPGDVTAPLTAPLTDPVGTHSTIPWPPVAVWVHQPDPASQRGVGGLALALSIVALIASFFVAWGLPLALVAVVVAIVALRRPAESRIVSGWALALGLLALLFSAGWLWWTLAQFAVFDWTAARA